jgi:hypothetical protein
MKLFEGKTPSERNKIIVALVLGVLSVLAIGNMIFQPFSGSRKVTVNISPTPTASATPNRTGDTVVAPLPKQNEIDDVYTRIPVSVQYPPGASEPGRNIFAFYEPPIPTPYVTPSVVPKTPKPETPVPVPTPNVILSFINKQSVYAGEPGFSLVVGGDKFTPETYIFFNGTQLPTNYTSPQQLSAEIPANYIAGAGQKTIEIRSPDGKLFSNPIYFNVQAPPLPQFQYLGIVSRKRGNNDTAYIMEQGKTTPSSFRLNDIIGGRFRLVSISPAKLLVQDINLTFLPPYPIELIKGAGQTSSTSGRQFPNDGNNYTPYTPNVPTIQNPQQCPPGIPCNVPRYIPPTPNPNQKDVDDNDDDDDGDN